MKALLIVFVSVGTPLTVICVRVGQNVVNDGVRAIMFATAFFIAAMGVAILLHAIATIRQAQFPAPSHNIDARRQTAIDARQISQPATTRAIEEAQ